MKSYIHLYKTNQEFTKAYNGPDYVEPWLSLTEENMTIGYSKPKLTAITFDNITWVKDVPATGGTATKDNCEFKVYGKYNNGISVDISSDATVTGELVVEPSTADTRQSVGTLTLTASYGGFSAKGNVTVYQAAVDFSTKPLTFKISSHGTINWTATDSSLTKAIEYKLNDNEWASITSSTEGVKIEVDADDKIQFIGNNTAYSNEDAFSSTFGGSTAGFEIEGNIMSLINSTDFSTLITLESNFTFAGLFGDCTGLTSAENLILPATTLASNCYGSMFEGCIGLTTAPALPANTLAEACYQSMFNGCSSLTAAPELPATTLVDSCYDSMFYGCSSLTTAPALPATTLTTWCYYDMFDGCTSLTAAPELPATTLSDSCYYMMFYGCSSLTTAPALPATTLTTWCYYDMFDGCTSLTAAPELPATTLSDSCYYMMFYGCTKLNYIKCLATDISATDCTSYWVDGVAATGTFVKNLHMEKWTTGSSGIPSGWAMEDNQEPLTFNILSDGTINWTASNTTITKTIDYKVNDNKWVSITSNTGSSAPTINVVEGDKIQFKGNNTQYATGISAYNSFSGSTASFEVEGNIMSLIYGDNFKNNSTISSTYTFTGLFKNCTKLVSAEYLILPSTTLANTCYANMFNGCTSLTTAPELPATTLANTCYSSMFNGCTSLTTAPELPATTLVDGCYSSMFYGCTSLTTAPELPATTLANTCYANMFQGCTNLNYIKCLAENISADSCTSNWVDGVAATGTFVKSPNMAGWTTGVKGIPSGWAVADNKEPLTFKISSPGTVNWTASDSSASKTIEYKLNDSSKWLSITSTMEGAKITVNPGDKIQFRGNNAQYATSSSNYNSFSGSTASFELEGSIMSLINSTDFITATTLESNFTFAGLFSNCTGLTSAENLILPSTTLANSCYSSMFNGCSSLTTAPELPATNLANNCYNSMFYGCTSLTTAPALSATKLADSCYFNMFQGCTSLITAPVLPASTLASSCYLQMFSNCTSLTTAPALPATTLAEACYQSMFNNCTKLTTAPVLPATTLKDWCYNSMFYGCTSLTTAPVLPATTLKDWCYSNMFKGCTSLTIAPELPATNLKINCYSNMFKGCTSLTIAPELPATNLADNCYDSMFQNCTSLTTAPVLPASTLESSCYTSMFNNCTSLNYIKCLATDIPTSYCTKNWVDGVASTGTFVKASSMTSWSTGIDGIPSGWTVQNA